MEDATDAVPTTPPPPPAPAAPAAPLWVSLANWVAIALVALVGLEVIGIVVQGIAIKSSALSSSDRIGYSFLQNLDKGPLGFELLAAVFLVLIPVIARRASTAGQDRNAQIVLTVSAALAFLVLFGGILAVPAQLHLLHLQKQPTTGAIRWALVTFVLRNVGTAGIALVAAVAGVRVRFQPRRLPVETEAP
jgi:hypothetical protein